MPRKTILDQNTKNLIFNQLESILSSHEELFSEEKLQITCFYVKRKSIKKLFAYINPRKHEIVIWFSHHWTNILTEFPFLKSIADEIGQSMMKFSIKKMEDIELKAIEKIINLILPSYKNI